MSVERWQHDTIGYFIEMPVGEKAVFGVDWTDYLASGQVISTGVWTLPVGVTVTNPNISGAVTQATLEAITAGEYAGSVVMTVTGGVPVKPLLFRVVVR